MCVWVGGLGAWRPAEGGLWKLDLWEGGLGEPDLEEGGLGEPDMVEGGLGGRGVGRRRGGATRSAKRAAWMRIATRPKLMMMAMGSSC